MKRMDQLLYYSKHLFKLLLVIGVFVGMFSYAMFQGGFVSWFLFYSITILVILMLAYVAIPLGNFHVKRELSGGSAIAAGSEVEIKIIVKRKWPFPFLYLSVSDEMDRKLKNLTPHKQMKMIFYPTLKRELEFTYAIPNLKRGEYVLKGVHLETSDMFGVFYKRKFIPLEESLLVYPNYHEIERWSALENRETETRLSSFDFIEDITSVAGAREYVPGDKLTSIDWKVTARSTKLMTKEFEEYTGQRFLVILNNHLPDVDSKTLDAYEKSIELATSFIMHANRKQIQLGLWTIGKESSSFPLDAGSEQQKQLIYHLSKIQGDISGDFTNNIKEFDDKIPLGVTLLVVSTELTDGMLERFRVYLSRRIQVYFCLIESGKMSSLDERRFRELKGYGAEAYLLSGGNIDHAIPS
ncbi:DUF58 domain-containing protein [Evansella sp. AB-P1]|uniref:DUF58 domain-containing protein n=1 Tax=Evansella sp. AB-P1 TaxID=3037653 RepID=UPI00241E878E|nr:DUF58 domain-containing protein [Evansella sp. AB-P1]MDG5785916.1 DUF58 domain-containing protein [Evansella sp. AB-P1]